MPTRSHVCARPLNQTTIESDSSKVEVVEKKLLLLPNFDQLKHSRCTEPLSSRCLPCICQYQSALSRPFRCMFNPETRIYSLEYMLDFLRGKISDTSSSQHVRLPVQTPEEATSTCQYCACATQDHSAATATCCCLTFHWSYSKYFTSIF